MPFWGALGSCTSKNTLSPAGGEGTEFWMGTIKSASTNSLSLEGEGGGEGGNLLIFRHFVSTPWNGNAVSARTLSRPMFPAAALATRRQRKV